MLSIKTRPQTVFDSLFSRLSEERVRGDPETTLKGGSRRGRISFHQLPFVVDASSSFSIQEEAQAADERDLRLILWFCDVFGIRCP